MGERANVQILKEPGGAENPETCKGTKCQASLAVICCCFLALCLVCGFNGSHMQSSMGGEHLYVITILHFVLFINLWMGPVPVEALLQMQENGLSLIGMFVFLDKHGIVMSHLESEDSPGCSITQSRIVWHVAAELSRGHDP